MVFYGVMGGKTMVELY